MTVSPPVSNAFFGEYFSVFQEEKCNSQTLNLYGPSNAESCRRHFAKAHSLKR